MNKLIIIGNGFDLAHNLPTSYRNFIDSFWETLQKNRENEIIKKVLYLNDSYDGYFGYGGKKIGCYSDFLSCIKRYANNYGYAISYDPEPFTVSNPDVNVAIFSFKNEFLRVISEESIVNWVDIENKYYEILKALVNNNKHLGYKYPKDIISLNNELEEIKVLLQEYIKYEVIDKYDFKARTNTNPILDIFKIEPKYLKDHPKNEIFLEFPPEDHKELIQDDSDIIYGISKPVTENLFLDFNYTPTTDHYVNEINNSYRGYGTATLIKIHGAVYSNDNPVNFGFGDEMDDDYKIIEKTGNNNYLKNIKSFQYMHTSNYRKLLNWIETGKFQVLIFGHSCSLSDRTLLNTIFENHNCRSIKIFFHKNENSDNYTELTHNISRHFNQKKLMRSKLVDKTLCSELPQTVRFKERK